MIDLLIKQSYCDLFSFLYTRDAVGEQNLCPHDVWFSQGSQSLMEWGGRREEGSGWGTHVYLWRIHFDIWQN